MSVVELTALKPEAEAGDIWLEDCAAVDNRLSGLMVVVPAEKKEEVVTYIKTSEIFPEHLLRVWEREPVLAMNWLLHNETGENASFTREWAKKEPKALPKEEEERKEYTEESREERGERLPITYWDVEPVTIKICGDFNGKLSDMMDALGKETGQAVIPFALTEIAEEVDSLKRYDVQVWNGMRYALSKEIRKEVIDRFQEEITESLTNGIPYNVSLWTTFRYKDSSYDTLLLTASEWSLLCSLFRKYDAGVFLSGDDIRLVIGG